MWSVEEDGEARTDEAGEGEAEPDNEPERCLFSGFSEGMEVVECERWECP